MISTLDLIIILVYILFVFIIAAIFSVGQGIEGYLVNRRATKLLLLVTSIVSTNVGAGFFLSVAAESYVTGISFGVSMMIVSTVTSLTIAALSGKVKSLADAGNAHTIPELLAQRYESPLVGIVAAVIIVAGYLFVTALQFVGIGSVGSVISGINFSNILLLSGVVTVAYTAIGGIRSDLVADAISFAILVAILVIVVPVIAISDHVKLSALPATHLDLFAFGGVSFFMLSIVLAAVSSFMFMELWQRVFAAESVKTAQRAFIASAIVQPIFIGVGIFLGLSASLLYKDVDKSEAIFKLMAQFLPPGFLGLGLVAVLVVLMTTVNSLVLVGGSILFTGIVRPRLGNVADKKQLVWVRFLTIIFGFCALGLAYLLPDLVRLLLMGAFVMMPICPAIAWALFSQRRSAASAVMSMLTGILVTLILLPRMPNTAFGPGFLVSTLVILIFHFLQKAYSARG